MTDYTKLAKALTCGNDGKLPCHNNECPYWVDQWHGIGLCNVIKKDADAAAAIEDLQAQMPKRGEWKTTRPDAPMFGFYYCSICGRKRTSPQDNYCPNCGAKMEVQDGV